jgi:hypothetical protein
MAAFDAATLDALRDLDEVALRTRQHADKAVVIWSVVTDGALFVRSARGAKGRWYRDVTAEPQATLEFSGRRVAVQAVPVGDAEAIARVSGEYLRKYRSSPYARSVVAPAILSTTLRLEPV